MKQVKDEGIWNPQKYQDKPGTDKIFLERAIGFVLKKIDGNLAAFTESFPGPVSTNNVYGPTANTDWTTSFWTGLLWLAYEVTGDLKYRKVAEIHLKSFRSRVEKRIGTDTHDLGFLYTLSCMAAFKLTGDEMAKETALMAAELLTGRYYEKAGIIQAWGNLNDPAQQGRMIIDCLMNLPLLYWAFEMTGEKKYRNMAYSHAQQAAKHIVREDASCFHTFYMDIKTGQPREGKTCQGFSDESSWARGQAWAIYGFPLSYKYTRDESFLDIAVKMANYFLNRLPEDDVCYWDLIFTSGDQERDSSSAAIAACGMLELTKHLPQTHPCGSLYENAAKKIILSLTEKYTSKDYAGSNGILLHGVYNKPGSCGVDECCIWGDYFYFEALIRLQKDWKPYW